MYLTVGDSHLRELESLLLRIVRPSGNKQIGKFSRKCQNLRQRFASDVRRELRAELADVLGLSKKRVKELPKERNGRACVLAKYIRGPMALRGRYKGKVLRARVRKDGAIRCKGRVYTSPSLAGAAAQGKPTCNGWGFWLYERAPGDWVRLTELRRNGRGR